MEALCCKKGYDTNPRTMSVATDSRRQVSLLCHTTISGRIDGKRIIALCDRGRVRFVRINIGLFSSPPFLFFFFPFLLLPLRVERNRSASLGATIRQRFLFTADHACFYPSFLRFACVNHLQLMWSFYYQIGTNTSKKSFKEIYLSYD